MSRTASQCNLYYRYITKCISVSVLSQIATIVDHCVWYMYAVAYHVTAWAPKPWGEVQRHLSHSLPARLQGGSESPETAKESLWQETHLHNRTIRYHRSQQRHHLERHSPQDQHRRWSTKVCTLLHLNIHLAVCIGRFRTFILTNETSILHEFSYITTETGLIFN